MLCFGPGQKHYVALYDSLTPRFFVGEINDTESLLSARRKLTADHDNMITSLVKSGLHRTHKRLILNLL